MTMNREVYRELLRGYFRSNPDERSFDLIQTMDFYGKKFELATGGKASFSVQDFMQEMAITQNGL